MSVWRSLVLALALGAGAVSAATAQAFEFAVAGTGCRAREDAVLLNLPDSSAGWCGGAVAWVQLGPLVLEGGGFRVKQLAQPGGSITRDAGEIRGVVALAPVRWISLEGSYTVRAFSSAMGYQRWQIPGAGVKVAIPLGDSTFLAYVRGHYLFPALQQLYAGQTSGDARYQLGLSGESGLIVRPGRAPVVLGITYRLERFDFPELAAGRLEHFEVISAFAGLRLGRFARPAGPRTRAP
ncbi:MAG: hypothetical protein KatS3mg081_2639 [Gemmatimonadales bacterium]|nr:MAG: hypothetical protein KatS3mg081_2639 [Gemmatimonadales bacterium]